MSPLLLHPYFINFYLLFYPIISNPLFLPLFLTHYFFTLILLLYYISFFHPLDFPQVIEGCNLLQTFYSFTQILHLKASSLGWHVLTSLYLSACLQIQSELWCPPEILYISCQPCLSFHFNQAAFITFFTPMMTASGSLCWPSVCGVLKSGEHSSRSLNSSSRYFFSNILSSSPFSRNFFRFSFWSSFLSIIMLKTNRMISSPVIFLHCHGLNMLNSEMGKWNDIRYLGRSFCQLLRLFELFQ